MKKVIRSVHQYIKDTDKILWLLCIACSAMSVITLCSQMFYGFITSKVVITQSLATGIGIVMAIIISKMDYHIGATFWKWHVVLCVGLVLATFIFGIQNPGADDKAWLPLPFGMTLQPTELLKLSFIFTFGMHLESVGENINQYKNVLLLCLHGIAPVGLVVLQGDDGTALSFVVIFLAMLFSTGISWRYVAAGFVAAGVGIPILWNFVMSENQKQRFLILADLSADAKNIGYQQSQGLIAIGTGQTFGTGLFSNVVPREVPYARNDFIFSYIGQTLGFVGCLLVIAVLLAVTGKVLATAGRSADRLGYFLCVGIFAILLFQILANIGMCLGIMPVIGLTLPFLSAGGTSVIMLYMAIGLVLSVYMNNKQEIFS